ncbi:uncharacterized protein [Clytia hemisphaerica]|uniref:uncharacterized protein n=1 Tax=Clytia hemisphaerica TaxID=252671 RepID=UPI0034D51BF5
MDVRDFQFVLSKISDLISPTERSGGTRPINADERLSLTLRYLATGESLESLSFQFRICANAVSYIIKGCCNAIVERLEPEFLMPPENKDQWSKIAKCFEERWNYPHALGAVDGKHIRIIEPKNKGSRYYNYKHTHSIILLAVAGPNYECLYADVGTPGRANDSGIWNRTSLMKGVQDGTVDLPNGEKLGSSGESVPHVFLGDDAFALRPFVMKPFPQQGLNEEKRIYNYRHSRGRRISENLFGILASRWRVFFTVINFEPDYVEDILLATLVLHNMLIKSSKSSNAYRPPSLVDGCLDNGEISEGEWCSLEEPADSLYPLEVPRTGHNSSITAKSVREKFMDYFIKEGAVEWQWKYC